MRLLCALATMMLLWGCGGSNAPGKDDHQHHRDHGADPTDIPVDGLTAAEHSRFSRANDVFDQAFGEADGLGPIFITNSCDACHTADSKGPGKVTRMVIVGADGVTRAEDQSALPYGSVERPMFTSQLQQGVTVPAGVDNLKVSLRIGPAVFGRGWMEAVEDAEIEAQARFQAERAGPERGRVPRLRDGRIGRFGLKARVATLEEFVADAFNGDMGLTSSLFPEEPPNPEGIRDDQKPGTDIPEDVIADLGFYMRVLAIPRREGLSERGRELFERARCATCHVPELRTRADFPVPQLAGKKAAVYSDLLLHDMGTELADGIVEGAAREREWRTAPLMGLRHLGSYLHDGRARTLEEAIRMHGGVGSEANASVQAFDALSAQERGDLLDFLRRL